MADEQTGKLRDDLSRRNEIKTRLMAGVYAAPVVLVATVITAGLQASISQATR